MKNVREINDVLGEAISILSEKSKRVGPDLWKVDGKEGRWRTIANNKVFIPGGGGTPIGIPKALAHLKGLWNKLKGKPKKGMKSFRLYTGGKKNKKR
jgi:hypothetical protein